MQFVTIHGNPMDLSGANPARKAVKDRPSDYHKGYLALGFSSERIEDARLEHEAAISKAIQDRLVIPQPWDAESWMRSNKPTKIRSKPYEILDAATQCCLIASKAGWRNCRVEPVMKGGKQ